MVKCQVCGEEIGNAIFCENCGSKIPSQKKNKKEKVINNNNEKQEKKFCANCGSEMASEDKFCSNCGTHELKATNQVCNNLVATFNPGTAFLISIYTTGAGHIYLGLFKRGISFLISQIVLVVLVAIFTLLLGYLWYMLAVIVLLLGILACLTLHIYSIYDSYKSIKKITNGESVEDIMFFNKFMWIFSLNPWGKIW